MVRLNNKSWVWSSPIFIGIHMPSFFGLPFLMVTWLYPIHHIHPIFWPWHTGYTWGWVTPMGASEWWWDQMVHKLHPRLALQVHNDGTVVVHDFRPQQAKFWRIWWVIRWKFTSCPMWLWSRFWCSPLREFAASLSADGIWWVAGIPLRKRLAGHWWWDRN